MMRRPDTKKTARGYRDRRVGTRDTRKRFLIVCEGAKTEPLYFKGFPVSTMPDIREIDVQGIGMNTLGLVQEAIRIRNEARGDDRYDEIWCVFDRDSFPAEDFNDALALAERENVSVAYSNEAFELWYLLHFDYIDAALSRDHYGRRLTEHLNRKYEKNCGTMYVDLLHLQDGAIRNATRLLSQYEPPNPERDKPSTTVHKLVLALNKYLPGQP